jgi:hypothetical protein
MPDYNIDEKFFEKLFNYRNNVKVNDLGNDLGTNYEVKLDSTLYKDNKLTDEGIEYLKNQGFTDEMLKHYSIVDGKVQLHKDASFLDKYGEGIGLGVAVGGLALNTWQGIQNMNMLNAQKKLLNEQLKESKEEYKHIKDVRSHVNTVFNN